MNCDRLQYHHAPEAVRAHHHLLHPFAQVRLSTPSNVIERTCLGPSRDLFSSQSPSSLHSFLTSAEPSYFPYLHTHTHSSTCTYILPPPRYQSTILCTPPHPLIFFLFVFFLSLPYSPFSPIFLCEKQSLGASPPTDYLCVGGSFFCKGLDSNSKWFSNPGFWKCTLGA